ncbi:NirD/YgiW/YdeI family stress tolerance protein [Vibrio mediterranei]|nr:NirD/YgiW/YdeI family stress tolerance protein [Vibrio mediterranei]
MKKIVFLVMPIIFVTNITYSQGYIEQSLESHYGFSGPSIGISSVKQVVESGIFSDDQPVTLRGRIKASLGGEQYLFVDSTGQITVEIEYDKWLGQVITPSTNVQLSGEIDRSLYGLKVDVDFIKILSF